MGTTLIKVNCLDQRLLITSAPAVASGGRNEDEIEFSFCPLWSGFTKTAVFYRSPDEVYRALLSGDKCVIPHEVLAEDGVMYFGVFGVSGDITRTSEVIQYRVLRGALTSATKPTDPTPDIYTQLLSRLATIEAFTVPADPYMVTGGLVQIDNFEGMPMLVMSAVDSNQEGSGDPYPGGAGKNLMPPWEQGNISGTTGADTASSTIIRSGFAAVVPGVAYALSRSISGGAFAVRGYDADKNYIGAGDASITRVSGGTASNPIQSDGKNAVIKPKDGVHFLRFIDYTNDLTNQYQLEVGSTATEYVPYENIRPLHGWTAANLMRCGKNMLPYPYDFPADLVHFGMRVVTDSDGRITITGTVAGTGDAGAAYLTPLNASRKYHLPVGQYRLFGTPSGGGLETYRTNVRTYKLDGTQIANMGDTGNGCRFEVTEETAYIDVYISIAEGYSATGLVFCPMIIPDDGTAKTYEPYKGDTFRADFGRTVYGGTVDWHKGTLTIDRVLYTCTGTETIEDRVNVVGNTYKYRVVTPGLDAKWPASNTDKSGVVCSHYVESAYEPQYFSTEQSVALHPDGYITIRTDKTTPDAFKAWLAEQYAAGTPVQICVPLKTPTTIQLTPQDIVAVQGLNNIWSDSGETTVSGRKDVFWYTKYLQEQIAYLKSTVDALTAAALTE